MKTIKENGRRNSLTKFKIQKGIPIPAAHWTATKPSKYPFEKMKVGDSFLMWRAGKVAKNPHQNLQMINRRFKPKHFLGRMVDEGFRVWRDK